MKTVESKPTKQKKEVVCPECGLPRIEWPDNGVKRNHHQYCCDGCADGTGCTCLDNFEL